MRTIILIFLIALCITRCGQPPVTQPAFPIDPINLPASLKFRWTESYTGDYLFNITFFELLRRHCKTFDQHIYGEISYHEKKLEQIFSGGWIYNEITAEHAANIKSCITSNKAFAGPLLKHDKEHFIEFLDHVIDGSWRLVMLDWN